MHRSIKWIDWTLTLQAALKLPAAQCVCVLVCSCPAPLTLTNWRLSSTTQRMALITLICKERAKERRERTSEERERELSPAPKDKWSWQDCPELFRVTHFYLHFRLSADNSINDFSLQSKASKHLVLPPLNLSVVWSSFPLQSPSVSSLHSPLLYTRFLSQQLEKGNTPARLLLKEVMTPYEENLLKSSSFFPFLFTKTDDRFSLACTRENCSLCITVVHLPFLTLVSFWIFITFNLGMGHKENRIWGPCLNDYVPTDKHYITWQYSSF